MNKPKLKTVLITSILLAFVVAGGWVWYGGGRRSSFSPSVRKESIISISRQGDKQVVRNTVDKFQVTIPREWVVSPGVDTEIRLRADKSGPGQPDIPTEVVDGVIFRIYIDQNAEQLTLKEWLLKNGISDITSLTINHKYQAYQKLIKIPAGPALNDLEPDMVVDTEVIFIYLQKQNNEVFELECAVAGSKYQQYANECVDIIQSFVLYDK